MRNGCSYRSNLAARDNSYCEYYHDLMMQHKTLENHSAREPTTHKQTAMPSNRAGGKNTYQGWRKLQPMPVVVENIMVVARLMSVV